MYSIIDNIATLRNELKGDIEGYIWLSGENTPVVDNQIGGYLDTLIKGEKFEFIVEGFILSGDDSYSIRYANNNHIITKFSKAKLLDVAGDGHMVKYQSHKRLGEKVLKFCEIWLSERDPLCEGMSVLRFKALAFVGYN